MITAATETGSAGHRAGRRSAPQRGRRAPKNTVAGADRRVGLLPAWAAVHQTGPALLLLVAAAAASVMLSDSAITSFGFIQLAVPVSALLLVPALAGLGAAVGSVNSALLPLPDGPRAMIMRLAWFAGLLGVAVAAAVLGVAFGGATALSAIARNVVFNAGLGLLSVKTDGRFIWMPTIILVLAAMLFGHGAYDGAVAWWAFILSPEVTAVQLSLVAATLAVGLINLARPPKDRLSR